MNRSRTVAYMVRVYIDCVSKSNSPVNMITPRVWIGVCRCLMVKSSFGCYKDVDKLFIFAHKYLRNLPRVRCKQVFRFENWLSLEDNLTLCPVWYPKESSKFNLIFLNIQNYYSLSYLYILY